MSDDIVTRLRMTHKLVEPSVIQSSMLLEAADEIERLREERDKLRIVAKKLYLWLVPDFDDDEIAKAGLQAYAEFVRLHKEIGNES